jgi:hypothetical protein
MVSAAWIGRENLDADFNDIVRTLLIRSMAGMTVVRFIRKNLSH